MSAGAAADLKHVGGSGAASPGHGRPGYGNAGPLVTGPPWTQFGILRGGLAGYGRPGYGHAAAGLPLQGV
jgi:hypothetical protein